MPLLPDLRIVPRPGVEDRSGNLRKGAEAQGSNADSESGYLGSSAPRYAPQLIDRQRLDHTLRYRNVSTYQVPIPARTDPVGPSVAVGSLGQHSIVLRYRFLQCPVQRTAFAPVHSVALAPSIGASLSLRCRIPISWQSAVDRRARGLCGAVSMIPFRCLSRASPSGCAGLPHHVSERVAGIRFTSAGDARRAPDLQVCRRSRRHGLRSERPRWSNRTPRPATVPDPRPLPAASAPSG